MANDFNLLKKLENLPSNLEKIINSGGISVFSTCTFDTSDCASDDPSCTSDYVCQVDCNDCIECPTDGVCTKDIPVEEWYAVQISTEGISSMQIAYYDANGTRVPPGTGYSTYDFSNGTVQTFYVKAGMKLYIHKIISFEDGYGCPWTYAIQSEIDPTVSCGATGNTENVSLHIYPESYCTVQIIATNIAAERPDDWSWWSTISSGSAIAITAAEWNAFTTRINEFREYADLSSYSFTTVSSGTPISYWIVNQARTAISEISGHGSLPSAAVSGGKISASFFNSLASALNSIP